MKHEPSTSRGWLALALLLPGAVFAQTAQLPGPADLEVGDTWRWQQIDDRTQVKERIPDFTVVASRGEKMFSDGVNEYRLTDIYVDGGYPLPGSDKKPSLQPWRAWPLEVGKKWTFDTDWTRSSGLTGHTRQDVEVVAYEEVEVPAGKFMAFRIVHKGFYSNSNNARDRQDDTYWYSPEVKANVKARHDDRFNIYTRALVSYTHRPAGSVASVTVGAGSALTDEKGRSYYDKDKIAATLVGKAVRMKRYSDGVTVTFGFNRDGSLIRQRDSARSRLPPGTWELDGRLLCLHMGQDNPCLNFFEENGVLKSGPRGEEARWEVLHVE